MKKIFQTTILNPAEFEGIGLHSGMNSKITILPAEANHGITFKRIDVEGKNNLVAADFAKVSSARLCTTLENNVGVKVSTVEHLLAALYFSDIDNAIIETTAEELPIMDGSAKDFLSIIKKCGIKTFPARRKFLKVLNKVEFKDGERKISIEPSEDSLEVEFQLNYQNKLIGKQKNIIDFQKDNLDEVAESRTFCLYRDIEKIKKMGLAKGGSLDNAVVVDDEKILNKDGLRNKKEFVNHKILDLAGDFILSGYRVLGKVKCYQGGHELTNLFLRDLIINKKKSFIITELKSKKLPKISQDKFTQLAVNA
tara:strand:- start:5872 stop:6801 length:930 start_codon:yes stop_codon:yes gene_type:complete